MEVLHCGYLMSKVRKLMEMSSKQTKASDLPGNMPAKQTSTRTILNLCNETYYCMIQHTLRLPMQDQSHHM